MAKSRAQELPGGAEELFAGHPESLEVYRAVRGAVEELGGARERVTRSQVAWARRRGFAYAWRPGQYVRSTVPLVLSVALPRQLTHPRVKEVAHPSPGTWMHHLELSGAGDVDEEVVDLLRQAAEAAGPQQPGAASPAAPGAPETGA
ncbi:DUF5655 domain-containing protein [Pedococcus sp. NPDC057267]|uniref:DUF5655 domain-containing protein n=1 Tax=Pedococcus sp. NPDC057267 TaxID=3346077 RepID=UPI00362F9536